MLLFDLPNATTLRCNGTSFTMLCHRDGGHTINVARAVNKPNETGPNVLLSNE